MITAIQKISKLIEYLPEKDIKYAEKFVKRRDFHALRDLVKSDIHKANKNITNQDDLYVERLYNLKAEIDSYILLGDIEDDDNINFWDGENC